MDWLRITPGLNPGLISPYPSHHSASSVCLRACVQFTCDCDEKCVCKLWVGSCSWNGNITWSVHAHTHMHALMNAELPSICFIYRMFIWLDLQIASWVWNTCKWWVTTQMTAIKLQSFKRWLTIGINMYYSKPHGNQRIECLTQLTTLESSTINL
jgi:hypothetical protein